MGLTSSITDCPLATLLDFYIGYVLCAVCAPERAGKPIPGASPDL